ncbi:NAD(P)H-binding protein [Erythrobacter sp. SDW2]|uniref:NAD(P)H-binding protein n=1 Tax=Erythrobacter sp. SDW2 TaxID=2907154 RepID=UPI001F21306C|nr:NAD(P)H-binding protein [Erythrobacter sp. SDW2]UIP07822.1 NAD(P)H-binding protein [Erythrobacter sp. SDW2]
MSPTDHPKRVLLFGASGTIGQAVAQELARAGHAVTCVVRSDPGESAFPGCAVRVAEVTAGGVDDAFAGDIEGAGFDAVISCLASRSGTAENARKVDYAANKAVLDAARRHGAAHMILLSAICVQRPLLAFQHAKLAFEQELRASGLTWTIVRPTAFFKSLSGQVARVAAGKPFLLFGNGELTRCKPISDGDLARYIVACLGDPARHNRVLPIGGPGPAISPREQGAMLFELTGKPPRYRSVPVGVFTVAATVLGALGKLSHWAAEKAEYARIARYYATQSMLVLDPASGEYSESATPETGSETLREHYAGILSER